MNALGGIVWWNAVSNTPAIGTEGINSMQALIPMRFAGLWSGARSLHSSIPFNTSSVSTVELANFSPPCTTRCPTASISERLFKAPVLSLISVSKTIWTACLWVGISALMISLSSPDF